MPQLLSEGLILAAIGMGTVFFFLTTLVFATALMSRLANLGQPLPDTGDLSPGSRQRAAIAAAIHQYRQDHGHND